MKFVKLCRICAKIAGSESQNLFETNELTHLLYIEQLTGIMLRNSEDLPSHICRQCQIDLENAHQLRQRFFTTQQFFTTEEYKKEYKKSLQKNTIKENDNRFMEAPIELKYTDSQIYNVIEVIDISDDNSNNSESCPQILCEYNENAEETLQKRSIKHETDIRKKFRSDVKNAEKFQCFKCGICFKTRYSLGTHSEKHVVINEKYKRKPTKKKRPFPCQYCDKYFAQPHSRDVHERIHTNTRPYTCTYCGKAFTTIYFLETHKKIHFAKRKYKCTVCNKSYLLRQHLITHFGTNIHRKKENEQQKI